MVRRSLFEGKYAPDVDPQNVKKMSITRQFTPVPGCLRGSSLAFGLALQQGLSLHRVYPQFCAGPSPMDLGFCSLRKSFDTERLVNGVGSTIGNVGFRSLSQTTATQRRVPRFLKC